MALTMVAAVPVGIAGLVLIQQRKAWKCKQCGYVFD
jgi:hypothetical protein